MRVHPIVFALVIGGVAASCASDGAESDRVESGTAPASAVPASEVSVAPEPSDPPATEAPEPAPEPEPSDPPATPAPEPEDEPAPDLPSLFATYVDGYDELDQAYGRALSTAETPGAQVDARLVQMTEWSELLADLSEEIASDGDVPADDGELSSFFAVHAALSDAVAGFVAEVGSDRDAVVAELDEIFADDNGEGPSPDLSETRYRQSLDPIGELLEEWWAACLDLRRALDDGGATEELACGEPDEAPVTVDPSQEPTSDFSDAMPLPAGEHRLEYLATPLVVTYDETVVLRSSVDAVEIARSTDGPSIRVLTTGLIANPVEIGDVLIEEFPAPEQDLSGWLSVLPVTVDGSGSGAVAGADAEYWDVTSIADIEIVIAGGGDSRSELFDDLRLDPGESTRLWLVPAGEVRLLVNERWLGETDRTVHSADLDLLLAGVGLG